MRFVLQDGALSPCAHYLRACIPSAPTARQGPPHVRRLDRWYLRNVLKNSFVFGGYSVGTRSGRRNIPGFFIKQRMRAPFVQGHYGKRRQMRENTGKTASRSPNGECGSPATEVKQRCCGSFSLLDACKVIEQTRPEGLQTTYILSPKPESVVKFLGVGLDTRLCWLLCLGRQLYMDNGYHMLVNIFHDLEPTTRDESILYRPPHLTVRSRLVSYPTFRSRLP